MPRLQLFSMLALAGLLLTLEVCADDKAAADLKALAGPWRLVSLEFDGEKRDVPDGDEANVTFKDDKALVKDEEQFSIKVDASTDPKIIDFVKLKDPDKGQVLEGIYKLDGDMLFVCLWSGMGAKSRPSEFATKAGSNHVLVILKRN